MQIYNFLKGYLKKYRIKIVSIIIFNALTGLLTTSIPLLTGNFIDHLIIEKTVKIIYQFCFIIFIVYLIKIIMEYISSLIYIKIQTKIAFELNKDVLSHVQKMSLLFIDSRDTVYLNQIINNDSNAIVIFILTTVQEFFINVLNLLLPLFITAYINFKITLFLFVFIGLYVLIYQLLKKGLYNWSFKLNECKSQFFSRLQEQLSFVKFIQVNSLQNEIHNRLNTKFENLISTAIKYQKINFLFSGLNNFVTVLSQLFIYAFGGIQIIAGKFSVGMFSIFITYFNMMLSSVKYFYNFGKRYQDVYVSYNRLIQILDDKEEDDGSIILSNIISIKINSLSFSYSGDKYISYPDINFVRGNLYAITGENGKGKTTLINLLTGLYRNSKSGLVFYNNININEINLYYARKYFIGMADQHPILINDTIRYNLLLTDKIDIKEDQKIMELSKILNFDKFIENISGGLNYIINDKTTNLSGGEKQKISILRILLKDSDVMIFDEPTSFMDSNSIEKFLKYLNKISTKKLIILITHDENIIKICNKIYEL